MNELYSRQDLERLEKKYGRAKRAAALLGGAALLLCVLFCCLTERHNAVLMERLTVAVSVLGGWALIYLRCSVIDELRHEISHAEMLREGDPELLVGVLELSKERMRIRGSIRFYALTLKDGEETHRAKVIDSRAQLLREKNGKKLRLRVVNGYAAAWEEL